MFLSLIYPKEHTKVKEVNPASIRQARLIMLADECAFYPDLHSEVMRLFDTSLKSYQARTVWSDKYTDMLFNVEYTDSLQRPRSIMESIKLHIGVEPTFRVDFSDSTSNNYASDDDYADDAVDVELEPSSSESSSEVEGDYDEVSVKKEEKPVLKIEPVIEPKKSVEEIEPIDKKKVSIKEPPARNNKKESDQKAKPDSSYPEKPGPEAANKEWKEWKKKVAEYKKRNPKGKKMEPKQRHVEEKDKAKSSKKEKSDEASSDPSSTDAKLAVLLKQVSELQARKHAKVGVEAKETKKEKKKPKKGELRKRASKDSDSESSSGVEGSEL